MSRLVLPNQEFVLKRHKFHDGRAKSDILLAYST